MSLVKPTLVIGLGGAGINMVEDTEELIKRQLSDEKQNGFRYVGIDTHENVGEKIESDNIYPIPIPQPSGNIIKNAKDYHYLSGNKTLSDSEGGVDRTRPLARYHIDDSNNYDFVRREIKNQIKEFVAEFQTSSSEEISTTANINVWILNSLGGGTGSGLFLGIARLIEDINKNNDFNLYTCGVGAIPNLSVQPNPDKVSQMSEDYLDYHTNAYTAIKELEQVINHQGNHLHEHFIERDYGFKFSDNSIGNMDIDGPLFEQYYLLGQNPDKTEYHRLNRIAGLTVLFGARLAGEQELENFPDDAGIGRRELGHADERLFMVDASEIHLPIEPTDLEGRDSTLSKIADNKTELSAKVDKLDDLKDLRETIEEEIEYLKSIKNMKGGGGRIGDTSVRRGIIQGVNNTVTQLSHSDLENDDFTVESLIDQCLNDSVDGIIDDQISNNTGIDVDDRDIIKYICTDSLIGHISKSRGQGSLLRQHDFHNEIEDVCKKLMETEIIDYGDGEPFYEFNDPVTAWNSKLKLIFEERRDKHKQEAENQNEFFKQLPFSTDHESQYKRLRKRLGEINEKRDDYARLQQIKRDAQSKHEEASQKLGEYIDLLSSELENIQEEVDDISSEKNQLEIRIKNGREELLRNQSEYRYAGLGLNQNRNNETIIEAISKNNVSIKQLSTINDLIDEEFFTKQSLVDAADGQLNRISNPELHNKGNEPDSIVALFGHDDIINESNDNFLDYKLSSGRSLDSELNLFDYYSSDELFIETDNGFSIWIMALFTGIDLDGLYEYAHFNDYFVRPDKNVKDTTAGKSGGYNDKRIAEKFAYPELLVQEEKEYIYELIGHDS